MTDDEARTTQSTAVKRVPWFAKRSGATTSSGVVAASLRDFANHGTRTRRSTLVWRVCIWYSIAMFRAMTLMLVIGLLAVVGCRRSAAPVNAPVRNAAPAADTTGTPSPATTAASAPAARRASGMDRLLASGRSVLMRQLTLAREAYFETAREAANDPQKMIRAADRALAAGNGPLAVELFARACQLAPANADALMGLAMADVSLNRYKHAVGVYQQLLVLRKNDAAVRFNLAVALSLTGDLDEAAREYQQILDADAGHFRARYNLAVLRHAQGKLSGARSQYKILLEHAERLAPTDAAAAWSGYGEVLVALGETEDAFTAYSQAAKSNPNDAAAWLNMANAARGCGRYGQAVVACKRAARLAPMEAGVWARMGEIYLELHRATKDPKHLAEALECWDLSLRINPHQDALRELVKTYSAASQPASE